MGGMGSGQRLGLGPVFVYEWRISSRRWQGYALRSLFVASLLAALVVVWSGRAGGPIAPSLRGLAEVAELFFKAMVGTQLAVVLLAAPAVTAGAICLDRARGTLMYLLLTDLSDAEIVLGKLAARLVPVISMVVCVFPVMTLLTLLGGVDSDALLGALIVTLGVAVLGSSLALAFSLWVGKTHEALLGTYAVWGLWLLGPMMVTSLGGTMGVSVWIPPTSANPFRLAFAPYLAPDSVGLSDYLAFLGVTWALSAGLTTLAVIRLRAVCTRDGGRRRWWRRAVPLRLPIPGLGGMRNLVSRLPAPSLDFNPVLWREWHRNRPTILIRAVTALVVVTTLVFSLVTVATGTPKAAQLINGFLISIGLLCLSVTASTSLAEERARGSLDVLMATPLSTREIVLGKWLGAFRLVPLLAILPSLVTFAVTGWNGMKWLVAILLTVYVIAVGAAVTSLGVTLATWCTRLGRAVGLAVAIYVIVTVGWMFLVMAMMSPHPYGFACIAGSPFFGPIVITSQLESASVDWGDVGGVVLWISTYVLASVALLAATLATFDHCLGRIKSRPSEWRVRSLRPAERVRTETIHDSEFARK
ncbi:ABC-2 family transporter protein [Singulisphaera sp. GP187]|uniref:ABC transporter permease n=1 Tax=Singulisphaera sp. GP187 TaxID=1882752 RepID=UPI00092C2E7C|nr:ABC transporter permease subunit [Singulisphaera sp. GP187]SIO62568.1 ABC-2 family transporter protein [Singulisphaera sp. GP187]